MEKSICRSAAWLALLVLVACSGLWAEVGSLYYKELSKEGQVFVFNSPEGYAKWLASSELPKAITAPGRGARGETVVAENLTALDLYLFKHDLPAWERQTPAPGKRLEELLSYKDGKLTFKFEKSELSLSNRVQVRYTYVDEPDSSTAEDVGSFRVRRAQTIFEGRAYGEWKFKVQANWVGNSVVNSIAQSGSGAVTASSTRGASLEDAELQWARYGLFTVWAGQGKALFGRQELTSDSKMQFLERSLFATRFSPGRDQGVAVLGQSRGKTFEYGVGLYNGNQINQTANDNPELMQTARLVWTPFGELKLEESSHDWSETPRLALGAAWLANRLGTQARHNQRDVERVGAELAFRWKGLNLVGEWAQEESETLSTGATNQLDGYYGQVGFLFPNRKLEVAGRYSEISTDDRAPSSLYPEITEQAVSLSWYFHKHIHKLQADYTEIERDTGSGPVTSAELKLQLQLTF